MAQSTRIVKSRISCVVVQRKSKTRCHIRSGMLGIQSGPLFYHRHGYAKICSRQAPRKEGAAKGLCSDFSGSEPNGVMASKKMLLYLSVDCAVFSLRSCMPACCHASRVSPTLLIMGEMSLEIKILKHHFRRLQ